MLAAVMAAGRSETLKIEVTDRLLSGAAEINIASLIVNGSLAQSDGIYILTTAVHALAADTGGKGALGMDVPTATAFVLPGSTLPPAPCWAIRRMRPPRRFSHFSLRTMHPRF